MSENNVHSKIRNSVIPEIFFKFVLRTTYKNLVLNFEDFSTKIKNLSTFYEKS